MKKKCNFKKPLSLRDFSTGKLFEINKSDNKSVSQIPSTTVKRFFAKNSTFKSLPKSIYRDLIYSDDEYTYNELKDTILSSDTIYIQRKYSKFRYNKEIINLYWNLNENERSDLMNALSHKLLFIRRPDYQYDVLFNFLKSQTQNSKVSEEDSEMLKKIEFELKKTLDNKYQQEITYDFFKFFKVVRFAKK